MIVADSREKKNEHILRYFTKHGIEYSVGAVDTGDYYDSNNPSIRVERKASLAELAHNLLSNDKKRFYAEIRRAREQGIELTILCEHGGIRDLKDVAQWKPRFGKASGRALADAIFRLEIGYGVPVLYCDPRSTGRRILEILKNGENMHEE